MTKLDDKQQALLTAVQEAKERTDQRLTTLTKQFETDKYDNEAALRQAVLDAEQGGVPLRQIGLVGLGTQDYASVRRLLPAELTGVAPVKDKPASTVKGKPVLVDVAENHFKVTDAHGKDWEFWTMDFDGHLVAELFQGTTGPVPLEVMQTLTKRLPNADFTGIEVS